jgi:hypothetical protein
VAEDVAWRRAPDGSARSTRAIASLDGSLEVVVEALTDFAVGLQDSDEPERNEFSFLLRGGRLLLREPGRLVPVSDEVQPGDHLRVGIEGGLVKYRRNGRLLATSRIEPALPLVARASRRLGGAVIAGRIDDALVPEREVAEQEQDYMANTLSPVLSPAPGTYVTDVAVVVSGRCHTPARSS